MCEGGLAGEGWVGLLMRDSAVCTGGLERPARRDGAAWDADMPRFDLLSAQPCDNSLPSGWRWLTAVPQSVLWQALLRPLEHAAHWALANLSFDAPAAANATNAGAWAGAVNGWERQCHRWLSMLASGATEGDLCAHIAGLVRCGVRLAEHTRATLQVPPVVESQPAPPRTPAPPLQVPHHLLRRRLGVEPRVGQQRRPRSEPHRQAPGDAWRPDHADQRRARRLEAAVQGARVNMIRSSPDCRARVWVILGFRYWHCTAAYY